MPTVSKSASKRDGDGAIMNPAYKCRDGDMYLIHRSELETLARCGEHSNIFDKMLWFSLSASISFSLAAISIHGDEKAPYLYMAAVFSAIVAIFGIVGSKATKKDSNIVQDVIKRESGD